MSLKKIEHLVDFVHKIQFVCIWHLLFLLKCMVSINYKNFETEGNLTHIQNTKSVNEHYSRENQVHYILACFISIVARRVNHLNINKNLCVSITTVLWQ